MALMMVGMLRRQLGDLVHIDVDDTLRGCWQVPFCYPDQWAEARPYLLLPGQGVMLLGEFPGVLGEL